MANQPSTFIWYELLTSDLDAASRFYGAVVGWTSQRGTTPGMDYRMWMMGEAPIGGMMALPPDAAANGMPPMWLGYLNVANVDASIAKVESAGGALQMPATDIPNVGRFAMVTDPQGAAFYVMTPTGTGQSQSYSPNKPGRGGWHELHTMDWERTFDFYSKNFGWGKTDTMDMGPMGKYLIFNAGADPIGGMMNSPNFPRPQWLFYFNVGDIENAKNRVETAGGSVVHGPQQVPGGGSILQGRDPQGAMFALFSPAPA